MTTRIGDLARHTGVYGIGTIVGGIGRAALVPIIARYVPTAEYGKASVVLVFITLFAIVAELGFSSSLIKFVNEAKSRDERRRIVSTIMSASLLSAVGLAAVCALLAGRLSEALLGSPQYRFLILIGIAGGVGSAILQVGLSFERARARSFRYVFYTLLKGGLALTLSVVLVVALRRGALGLLLGASVPPLLIGILLYGRLIGRFATRLSRSILKPVLEFGTPLVPMHLAMWVLAYSDIYLLRRLTSSAGALSEVGLYQYAHEICLVLVLPITSLNLAWPQFLFANHSKPGAPQAFARVHLYFDFFLVEMAFLLAMFSDRIIGVVGSAEYAGSAAVMPYLAGSLVFYGFSIVFSSGLYVAGKTRVMASVVGVCAALNVVLNIVLIPRMGKEGAALATFATNAVMAFTILAFSQANYRIPFRVGRTLAGVCLAIALVAALRGGGEWSAGSDLLLRLAATAGFTLAFFAVLGLRGGDLRAGFGALMSIVRPRTAPDQEEQPLNF